MTGYYNENILRIMDHVLVPLQQRIRYLDRRCLRRRRLRRLRHLHRRRPSPPPFSALGPACPSPPARPPIVPSVPSAFSPPPASSLRRHPTPFVHPNVS